MKINRLIKAFSLLLVVAFTACSDFEDTELLSPEKPAGNQGVFFPTTNATAHELEPTDPTQITVKVSRTVSSGAARKQVCHHHRRSTQQSKWQHSRETK